MDELNRPVTPGPWKREGKTVIVQRDRGWICQVMPWKHDDACAIADLPAWIEAHDEWKARAKKAEAALADVWRILNNREHSSRVAGENAWAELIERGYGRPAE